MDVVLLVDLNVCVHSVMNHVIARDAVAKNAELTASVVIPNRLYANAHQKYVRVLNIEAL